MFSGPEYWSCSTQICAAIFKSALPLLTRNEIRFGKEVFRRFSLKSESAGGEGIGRETRG